MRATRLLQAPHTFAKRHHERVQLNQLQRQVAAQNEASEQVLRDKQAENTKLRRQLSKSQALVTKLTEVCASLKHEQAALVAKVSMSQAVRGRCPLSQFAAFVTPD